MAGLFPSLKLTYFDFTGRAEAVRIVLHVGGVPFIDERLTYAQFQERKPSLPYGKIPVLYVNGEPLAESLGILRFAARLGGLYPVNDAFAAMLVDEVLDADDEFFERHFSASFMEKDLEKKKQMREKLLLGPLPEALGRMDKRMQEISKYPLFASSSKDQLFVHEVLVWDYVVMFMSGTLEHIPVDVIDKYPTMVSVYEKVAAHPKVQEWLALAKKPKKLKLTYFDLPSRGEQIRLAFHIGGIEFEDDRVSFEEFPARKHEFPYGQMPVLYVDGQVAAQSYALLRYAGTRSGLYPVDDPSQALKIDEVLGQTNELFMALEPSLLERDSEKRRLLREKLATSVFPTAFEGLEKRLTYWKTKALTTSPFAMGGDTLTIADLAIDCVVRFVQGMAHVPPTIADPYKTLLAVCEGVDQHPRVQDWRAKHPPKPVA